ncbi:hypothetical protein RYX36_022533 [Vicia faba]
MGILQRIAVAYLITALCEIWLKREDIVNCGSTLLRKYRYQWALALFLSVIYLCLLYGMYVPDWEYEVPTEPSKAPLIFSVKCGVRGDTGPACNVVGMIDLSLLGIQHLYRRPIYARMPECSINSPDYGPLPPDAPSWCQAPFDPEGLLSSVMAIVTCLVGLHYEESLPVTRHPGQEVFSGSTCKQGEIEAVVIATGVHTFFGKAAHLVDNTNNVGHFQMVLKSIGNFCICSIAVGMLAEIIVMYPIQHRKYHDGIGNLERDISQTVHHNAYHEDPYAKEFGIKISDKLAQVEARILPAPWLKYHDTGREKDCLPQVGRWNMMNKKMVDGGVVNNWFCINFSRSVQESTARGFCSELARMCQISGIEFNPEPVVPLHSGRPDQVEKVLQMRYHDVKTKLQGKESELLIVILPDDNGSLYGDLRRICETGLGIDSQCCLTKNVFKLNKKYLANVSLKINVKVGVEQYVEMFRPLVLEEFKAQLQNSFLKMSSWEEMFYGNLSVMSIERIDDFHIVRFVHDDGDSATCQQLQCRKHRHHLLLRKHDNSNAVGNTSPTGHLELNL